MSLRELVPAGARRAIQRSRALLAVQVERAQPWNWELTCLAPKAGAPYRVLYFGTKRRRRLLREVLNLELEPQDHAVCAPGASVALPIIGTRVPLEVADETVVVSEAPLPGALRLAWSIHAAVPLDRPLEAILSSYDSALRRRLRARNEYRYRQVTDEAEIDDVNRTMLEAYAANRHGEQAQQLDREGVRRMAEGAGGARLDLLLRGEERVACHLGFPFTLGRKRYWETIRFGYPKEVFSDARRLADVNAMNAFVTLGWALDNGYDYYNLGEAPAHPEAGLMEWKRRRGGVPQVIQSDGSFFLRLPRRGTAKFLWDVPLFAAEAGRLTLQLGLPEGPSDEEVAKRYRQLGYEGLAKVRLHCARPAGAGVLDAVRALFAGHRSQPELETSIVE